MIETIYLETNKQVSHAVKIQVPDDIETPYEDKVKAAKYVLMLSLSRSYVDKKVAA